MSLSIKDVRDKPLIANDIGPMGIKPVGSEWSW